MSLEDVVQLLILLRVLDTDFKFTGKAYVVYAKDENVLKAASDLNLESSKSTTPSGRQRYILQPCGVMTNEI